jgi:hypothetical protein
MAETPTTGDRRPKTDAARQRQRDGEYKGLLHAVQKRKADNSADYATNFKHGQMAPDFERSAEAAGESREEVRSHFALLDRALLTLCDWFQRVAASLPSLPLQTDAASPRPPKLARALAMLLWRPLRLLRTQQNWEQLAICYRLQQVRDWRQKHPGLSLEQVEKFHQNLDAILENYHSHISPRLPRIEKRFWKVWRLYRALVGVVGLVFGTRDSKLPIADCRLPIEEPRSSELGVRDSRDPNTESREPNAEQVGESSGGDSSVMAEHKAQVTNSESQIVNWQSIIGNPLIRFRGTPHYEQFHPAWHECIDDLSPEDIADCFQSPSHGSRARRRRSEPTALKDPKDWQEHPPKPPLPEMEGSEESFELPASEFVRAPSERELRRLVRKGQLTVPGSLEEFTELVEEALGLPIADCRSSKLPIVDCRLTIEEPPGANRQSAIENRQSLQALAESLWDRMHVFSSRVAELRELLEATLVWEPNRFLPLWKKLLPVEQGYDAVAFFNHTHGPHHADVAWGEDEPPNPRRRTPLRPYITPRTEAENRQKHAGELQPALRLWLWAVEHTLVPALRGSHKVTVALYDWAVSRFGIREEFLQWRPNLSLAQLDTRHDRPEWAVRVVTVSGKTLVKLSDGRIFEPSSG